MPKRASHSATQDAAPPLPRGTGWWSLLEDGSIRRVWACRGEAGYVCLREISTPEQEAARASLASFAGALPAQERERCLGLVARIDCAVLGTPDLLEAFAFLGGDDSARSALLDADPRLARRDLPD